MSEFRNTRPDSPKGKVYTTFKEKGEAAARKRAEKLEIPAHKVNRWLKDNGAGFQAINDRTNEKTEAAPKAAKKKNGKAADKTPAKKSAAAKKTAAAPAKTPAKKVPAKKAAA